MAIQDEKNIPKSRVTLRYRTEINGTPEDITLPLRLLIAGDFSGYGDDKNQSVGERNLDDVNKRASLEKRNIFNAREILGVENKYKGLKLDEIQQYNSVFDRLNIIHKSWDVNASYNDIGEKFYTKEPHKKEHTIKKMDDFIPNYFDLGDELKNNNEILELRAKLSNDRSFYDATTKTLMDLKDEALNLNVTADEEKQILELIINTSPLLNKEQSGKPVTIEGNSKNLIVAFFENSEFRKVKPFDTTDYQDFVDFYFLDENHFRYISAVSGAYYLINEIKDFEDAKGDKSDKFYKALSKLNYLKSADGSGGPLKFAFKEQDNIKKYVYFNVDEAVYDTVLDDLDGLIEAMSVLETSADFKEQVIENYKSIFDSIKGNSDLKEFLELERLYPYQPEALKKVILNLKHLVSNNVFSHHYSDDGSLLINELKSNLNKKKEENDHTLTKKIDNILHNPKFKSLESNWRALEYLIKNTDFSKDIRIDFIDVAKSELAEDFTANRNDVSNSLFFKKIYTEEYDQFGGQPYSAIIGLYEFENTSEDLEWLKTMGRIANLAHSPFIASVGSRFFVGEDDISKLAEIRELNGHMMQSEFDDWNEFRDSEQAAYLGFTIPRFMIRRPYDVKTNKISGLNYTETIFSHNNNKLATHKNYCWANASILFASNMVKSYEATSWCQTIRGPKNGGYIQNLPRHQFEQDGLKLEKVPVEMVIPDYRELSFANCGFMPLVHKKDTSNACFFSSQSIKKPRKFKDPVDTENSQLVTNLSYTLSITKIAHYIKCIMRDNIGGTADAAFITNVISTWLSGYVTTVVNPDDLTLRRYPFKAITVETTEQEGEVGWYNCIVSISPHLQFEGLDTELRLETRL